jgi:dihydrodipicolinate synthase/N-acetylneuraminate lyase
MKTTIITPEDLRGVFPVPPLARKSNAARTLDFAENERIVDHLVKGGMTRFLYGGNAFLYHITLREYEELLEWLAAFPGELWAIPSLGPSFGRAIDQASILHRYSFPCAMLLPCADPRDAGGLEAGIVKSPI